MERTAKLVTLASMAVAVAVEAWFVSSVGWRAVWPLTIASFVIAAGIGLIADEIAAALVLMFSYVFPAVIILEHHRFYAEYSVIWMAGILGAIALRTARSAWAVPLLWKAPLILWALTVALAWPLVVLREIDFVSATLEAPRLASSAGGSFPHFAAITVLNVAATLGIGILWFDWLFLAFGSDIGRFRRRIAAALAVSWLAAIAVASYQLLGDLKFMSAGIFASMGRATATMGDANAFGMVAAVSGAMVVALSLGADRKRHWSLVTIAVLLSWIGLWASGSRTALMAGVITLAFLVWSARPDSRRRLTLSPIYLIAIVGAVVVLLGVGASIDLPAIGAVQRFRESLPSPTIPSVFAFLKEMWSRNNYGAVAAVMIRQHPLVGVGVGGYYTLVADYSKTVGSRFLIPPDNAQNWYRHQLAEFGLLGSVGWILWVVIFGWFVLVKATSARERLSLGILRGALVALALVSLVGMPTQNTAVALTLWTIAFWVSSLAGVNGPAEPRPATLAGRYWIGIGVVLCLFIGGTAYAARHDLRVPQRAARADWPYSYGFYDPEQDPDGRDFRWAQQRAVTVLPAATRWMRLTVSVNHADLARKPVDVRVWRDESMVLRTTLHTPEKVTAYVHVPDGEDRFVLETWVNRVVRPRDFGLTDPRNLGLIVQWDFVDAPPAGATTANR